MLNSSASPGTSYITRKRGQSSLNTGDTVNKRLCTYFESCDRFVENWYTELLVRCVLSYVYFIVFYLKGHF